MAFFFVFGGLVYFVQQQQKHFLLDPLPVWSHQGWQTQGNVDIKEGWISSAVVQCSGKVRVAPEERQLCQEAESWCGQRGKRQQEEGSDNSEASTAGHTKIFGQICPTVYGIGLHFPKVTKR